MEALEKRPLQCFRCMEKGHVKAQCCGNVDRSKQCYRCGTPGHLARDCAAPVHCSVCADLGRPAEHRVGSRACKAPKKKKWGLQLRNPPPAIRVRRKASEKEWEKTPASSQREPQRVMDSPLPSANAEGRMEVEPLEKRAPRERPGNKPADIPLPSDGRRPDGDRVGGTWSSKLNGDQVPPGQPEPRRSGSTTFLSESGRAWRKVGYCRRTI